MILTLIRHGQTEGSLRDLYYGAADIPVLPESLAELHAHAAQYPTAPRYFTSGLVRTEQTLHAIYGDVPHTALPGLRALGLADHMVPGSHRPSGDAVRPAGVRPDAAVSD